MRRKISLALAILLTVSAVSCGSAGTPDESTSAAASETTSAPETEPRFVEDSLPELDFGGEGVTWFCADFENSYYNDIWAESENGSMVNDSIYLARQRVEERLGTKIDVFQYYYVWSQSSEYYNKIGSMVLSGDTTYDAVIGGTPTGLISEQGYFTDLRDAKYLDLAKPWWNREVQTVMPSDNVYFLTGDATLALVKYILCVYFNEELLDSFGYSESMYDLVRDGKWTLSKMEEMIKDTYGDLNGDGGFDPDDRYGLTFGDQNKYRMLAGALGVTISEKRGDDYELVFINERTNDIFTYLDRLVAENPAVREAQGNTDKNTDSVASFGGNYVSKIFTGGNALFTASLVGDAQAILDSSKFTVGMIPFPKYDESDDYKTAPQRMALVYIPSTVEDEQLERSSAVLEAWASECYRSVIPTYFETSLKVRYSNDNDMSAMFDLLRENTVVNLDYLFNTYLDLNIDFFKKIGTGVPFMSTAEGLLASSEAKLETLMHNLRGE